jgi:hypothetical protein
LHNWFKNCTRYTKLVLKAEKFHGDVIRQEYKAKPLWKLRFTLRTFFGRTAIYMMLLTDGEEYSAPRWKFSSNEATVRGEDATTTYQRQAQEDSHRQ